VTVSLFGWHLVFGTKHIPFLPSPEKLAFSTYAVWSEQRRHISILSYRLEKVTSVYILQQTYNYWKQFGWKFVYKYVHQTKPEMYLQWVLHVRYI